jgi:hypothetical protein
VAGQIQFLSEASGEKPKKGPERQRSFCETSSRTAGAHIKFGELWCRTSHIVIDKGCCYETDIVRGKHVLCSVSISSSHFIIHELFIDGIVLSQEPV